MSARWYLRPVSSGAPGQQAPAAPEKPRRQLPPIKPRRPAAAVRKSLRAALALSASRLRSVDDADARNPAKARQSVREIQQHATSLSRLADELAHAIECEARYHLWRRGQSYDE